MKSNFFGYNKRLQPFANKLRKETTTKTIRLGERVFMFLDLQRIIEEIKPPPAPPPEGDNEEVTPSRGDSE